MYPKCTLVILGDKSSKISNRPLSLMLSTELTAHELAAAPVQVKSIDVASE